MTRVSRIGGLTLAALILGNPLGAQAPKSIGQPVGAAQQSSAGQPIGVVQQNGETTVDLQNALSRAAQYGAQIQSANILAQLAHEDKVQAKAATLPSLNAFNQFIYTEGNGTASGVFVANDGVHVYNEQLVVHQDLFSLVRRGEVRAAEAAEIVAKARADVAARGLKATVIGDYYAIASAQRKLANADRSLTEAQAFLDLTRKQERGGEAARADVVKAEIQVQQRRRDLGDAKLAAQKAKIALAILMFPSLQLNYNIVDDLDTIQVLPPVEEVSGEAAGTSPDLRAAEASLRQAQIGVSVARYAYLPSFTLDFYYGIDANQFAARTNYPTPESGRSTQPDYLVPYRQNLGYSGAATLNVPVWTWGSIHSKVKQAQFREKQAELDLTTTQKQLSADIASAYGEAETALSQVPSLRSSSQLSAESVRLTLLRYQAGEATTLEVVDAQTTANLARGAYDDGLLRYRLALAALETLTGKI
ncbi:MAG: TolC family protein [Acidobacteriaceae bacterium]|nr:TolC family protein [Acidobacteriaceae bacterium]